QSIMFKHLANAKRGNFHISFAPVMQIEAPILFSLKQLFGDPGPHKLENKHSYMPINPIYLFQSSTLSL
ncbi:MAG: hypothetical protein Q8807_04025, partial ['Waltheria sp.' little leaf phytoplasma]|nr:hypothetical protein ['Waltheria sp.' little leaf phytoplasma]